MTVAAHGAGLENTLGEVNHWFDGWRVIGIQEIGTTAQSLDELWPIHRGQHRDRGSPAQQTWHIRTAGRSR